MEKRLKLAKKLLKTDGVLIVTIDEHEINHLGMLLEKVFPEYLRYRVTIVTNPKGTGKANFSRVEEYAFFIVPDIGHDVIVQRPVLASLESFMPKEEDLDYELSAPDDGDDEVEESDSILENGEINDEQLSASEDDAWEYRHARRRGSESSYRHQRPNQFYPIFIDEKAKRVVRTGPSNTADVQPSFQWVDGLRPIWPIDAEGHDRVWSFVPESMQTLIDKDRVFLGKHNTKRDSWTINYKVPKKFTRKLKTVWWTKAYDAGTHGTELLRKVLGRPGLFQFPKSVYAVRDCIAAVVRDRPNALILDFFAGSGTTFHAVSLLNSQDGGRRRTIQVTNNEVSVKTARRLNKDGIYWGDSEFEKHGIFEQVTRPRCEAVLTGHRPNGEPIPGKHLNDKGIARGRPFSLGFEENVEFFRLDYLDPDDVDLRRQFKAILPALWLAAGGIGERETPSPSADFSVPESSTYAVLFKEARFQKFKEILKKHPGITNIWIVSDSDEAYAEIRSELPREITTSMLYRDYLRNFQVNGS
jgi:adenine-specific DNA-methyltransferase